jgi:hypothetical protein
MIAFALGFASAVAMLLAGVGWVLVQPAGKGLPRR